MCSCGYAVHEFLKQLYVCFYYYFGDFSFIQIGEQRWTENEQEGETEKD